MLAPKLFVVALVLSNGVFGRDTRGRRIKYRQGDDEYQYNHPPENYAPIPVAVVYESETHREDKSIKSTIELQDDTEEVGKVLQLKSEFSVKKEPSSTEAINSDTFAKMTTVIEEIKPKVTTYRPQREYQIPVAVVYEPEPTYYQKPRRNGNRGTNKRRKTPEPALEEKHTREEDNIRPSSHVNGHTGPGITSDSNNRDLVKSRKNLRRVPERQSVFKHNTPSSVKENVPIHTFTSDQTEEPVKIQTIQETAVTETEIPSKTVTSSDQTMKKQGLLNKRDKNQPLHADLKTDISQENENTVYVPKVDRSKYVNTGNTQQFSKRDNSTRVREVVPIVQSENVVFSQSGNFKYSYEGGDGTKAFEAGELKTFDDETAGEAVSGGFSFTAKDGNEYSLSYTADENGYRPVGAHLPTPPPIPPAIARALAYLATKPTPEPVTESVADYE